MQSVDQGEEMLEAVRRAQLESSRFHFGRGQTGHDVDERAGHLEDLLDLRRPVLSACMILIF